MIDVGAIGQEYITNGAPVLVMPVRGEGDVLAKDQGGRRFFGLVTVGLAFLRAVNAIQTDLLA